MKAYVTTIGELTTDICIEQLKRFGFEVVVLDGVEPWPLKYKRFIELADEDCIRVDADVVPNKNLTPKMVEGDIYYFEELRAQRPVLMMQWYAYDFYKNSIGISSPVFYSKEALDIIRKDWDKLDLRRPEASAWRLANINDKVFTGKQIVGLHGFFQDKAGFDRAMQNKVDRKQIEEYDFDLAKKLMDLNNG